MGAVLDAVVAGLPEAVAGGVLQNGGRESAIDAAMGLTAEEAANCYAKSLVTSRTIDAAQVGAEKKRVIARERVLTWHDPEPRGLDAVGGLENLKAWLGVRRSALSKRARDYGLPAPKGVLLVGVPGCGKSLTAKAVASAWSLPLLRLDMGALKSKWVGESEANIRKALSVAETVAPCVLWLDELEKALGGAVSGAADGGVSADALGAVLTWLQDRKAPVFVVATANQVELLPAELIRKGRFDEMFFVDLPTKNERAAVVLASLAQFNRTSAAVVPVDGVLDIDIWAIARATDGYSGAEIAALVPEALFAAFADGERAINTADLLAAAATVVPMSVSSSERVTKLREWSKGRCRLASVGESIAAGDGRSLDI
jgi:SpoVK/Ycf46/Vps4 family AAA+-type ATPase